MSSKGARIGSGAAGNWDPGSIGTTPERAQIAVGLLAAPDLPAEIAESLAPELSSRLNELYPEVEWAAPLEIDGLVVPPASTTDLIDAAHERLLGQDWEMAIALTDLPLRVGRRTVLAHASPTHRVAVISLPGLGPARLRSKALETAVGMVRVLTGEAAGSESGDGEGSARRIRMRRRLVELADLADQDPSHGPTGLAALSRGGRLRLLIGMIRANRPWRLAVRLYRALVAALAVAAFALVTPDLWRISASLGAVRLAAIGILAIAFTVLSLIAAHGLWERRGASKAEDQVLLFNAATAATVLLGVLSLYLALFLFSLGGAGLLITPDLLSKELSSDVSLVDYLSLAWLATSLAMIGGALGAGLETAEAVREAAYAYRPEEQRADEGLE
jgi:hypothetical protein